VKVVHHLFTPAALEKWVQHSSKVSKDTYSTK
jgi:hypothetical protein